MSETAWNDVEHWIRERIVPHDEALAATVERSESGGLPSIQVDPPMGKLLNLFARMVGARRVLEIGTLGGYSTIWLARALPPDGTLITLEYSPQHAEVAAANIAAAGFGDLVDLRVGPALDELPRIAAAGEGPFDLVFIDADKANQDNYLVWALDLTHVGSVIVGDNVVRAGRTIDPAPDPSSEGLRRFVELLAADPRIDATVVQTVSSKGWDGFALGLVVDAPGVPD